MIERTVKGKRSLKRVLAVIKKDLVLTIAAAAAILSCFFVPPSPEYLEYIDFKVLVLLFCLMAVVAGFNEIGLFGRIAASLVERAKSVRSVAVFLVLLCFFSAMLITNDVALITFVPFTILIFQLMGNKNSLIYVIVCETVAANLGSALTPVGNPQNLYLYTYYGMDAGTLFSLTLPLSLVSLLLVFLLSLLVKNGEIASCETGMEKFRDFRGLAAYTVLFVLCLLAVFKLISHWALLGVVVIFLLLQNRKLLLKVDYGLLLTFVCFFIFVGNISRIESVKTLVSGLLSGRELVASALLSQVISNVPAAVMLSRFTDNASALLVGTNVGGLGTLVASLASLISYKLYSKSEGANSRRYLGLFTVVNLALFLLLLLFSVWYYS